MNNFLKIINEELIKFLRENYDDNSVIESYFERESEIKSNIFYDFLYHNNENFSKTVSWRLIPFPRLKKIWEDYMKTNLVRDIKGLNIIENIMIDNIIKVSIFTNLAGHTESGDEEAFEDYIGYYVDEQIKCIKLRNIDKDQLEIDFDNTGNGHKKKEVDGNNQCNTTINQYLLNFIDKNDLNDIDTKSLRTTLFEELKEKFYDYYMEDTNSGQAYISDYGLKPLEILCKELLKSTNAEAKVVVMDKILNVVHQRSDIAAWFVEGGSSALSTLSGYETSNNGSNISGKYNMSDY